MNYKIVIFPLFLVTCLINQASPNCQQQPKVKHGHSSSSNVFSFNNLFNQQESSNNQQTWNQNLLFNPFELTFKAPGQTSQSHLGDNSNGLLVNPKVNNLASTSASSSSSGASASSSKVNGGQTHATNRQLFAPGLFDFFQEQPTKVNVNSHGQTVNKGTSVAPKQPSRGKQLLTPLETLKSSSESTSSSSTESTSFSEFPLLFSGLVSATDAQDDADDLLGLIQQHQSQWGQNLPTQLTGPKQGTKVPKVNSGASSLSSSSSFNSASSFPGSSLSLGHSPQQKLPKDDTIKARQQLQNSGKFLQDSISSSVASSPFSFDQLLTGEGPKNGQGVEKDSLTSIFSDDSSSSDSASATSNVKSINQINQLQSTADLIKSLQQKQSHQQQNIEKIESQSPYEQLLSSSGLTPQLLQSLSSSVSLSSSSSSSVPKVNNLGHISKSHEKHPAVDLNSFFQQESDNQNRNSIVDRGNKGALNIPAQVEQKTNEQTKPVKSSVTIPLLTFPSTSKHSSGRPERSGSASIHSQNSKSGQTGTSARINNHGSVTKPVTNTEHDTLFSSFSSSFTPIFNSAFQIQSNEQQNLADLATIIQRQQNQKLTDQQKSNKDQSQKSSQTSIPSSSSSSSTDSSSLSTEQIQKLNTFDLLKLIQQENNEEKTNSNEDLATKIGQNSDKSKHQPPINTNKPTSSSPSSLSASTSVVSTSPSTSKLSTSQTVLPLSSINAKLQSDSLINSAALSLAALSSSNLGSPITTANSPLINGKTNVPLSATESESSSDSSSTSGSSLISALNKLSQTPILPSSKSLSSSTSSQDSVISNQQIINQNLPVKNEKSTDHRQIQTDQNKQYNKQKTPSIIDSQPSLQLHSKSDLKTPIQSLPIEQVTENIKNQQKSSSTLPTTTSSLTALTDLSSLSTDQIQQLTKADFIGLLQNQNNKEKPTSHESLVPNIRQNSGKPTVSSDTESSSVSSSNSAFLTLPSTTKLSKQMSSSSAESSGTHLPLSVTASEAAIAAALSSLSDLNDDDDDDDDDDDETEDEESTEESSEIVKQSVRPVQTPIQPSSPTDLSSLSTARIQKINTEDLLKLTHPQNRKDKTTSEESSAPIIGQNSDKSKNRPTANTKPSPSSSSSAHSTSPSTLNSESNNNKHKLSAAQIYSEAGSMLTASSSLSDQQIKSLTASPSPKAKSSSLVSSANLDSLTTPPNTKLSKQLPTGTDVSSGENLPLVATNAAIGAGSAIATASALSSSDSDSSSVLLPLLHSSSLGYLSLQNDNQDSTDLKSGSIVTPLKKPTQTLITPAALSSSSLSTDLSSLTAEQIQQLTPEDLVKLLKQPNNQLDKTLSGVIPQNADQISGKDTKPLAVSSGRSSSSPSHSVLPASSTSPSTPSLHVQPAASIQPELTDSLTTSALASASVLSWLSAEQINQLTEAELMARIQQQQNNQRANISQKSSSSNGEKINDKGKNQEIKSMQAQANSALSVKPTPTTQPASEHSASSRVSTGQIQPTSSVNVNRVLQNQNNGLTNQQAAIVGSLSKPSQTPILPSSLSKSTSSQDSIISNQQIINQNLNLPVKNKESVERRQPNSEKLTQTEQNKQRNEQKTPSSMESHPSLQSHFKVYLKTPIQSPPSAAERVTGKSNNQQKLSTSASPTTPSSSLTSSTPLVSTAIESSSDSSSPSVSSLITAIPISDQKNKAPTNKQSGIQPTTSSSSPSTAPSKTSPSPSIGFKSIPESSANSDDHSQHQNKGPPSQIAPINGLSVKPLISNPSSTTSSLTSLTDLSSLSTGQIQQLTKADLITLLQNQNNKEKPTSQESSAPIIEQSSDRSKNRPTAPSSSSSTHSTSPPTSNSESNNNKHKSSAAQINSEAGSMLTASSWLSDEQIKSLTASPSTNAKSSSLASSAILDSLTTQPNTKLPKQTTISSGASLEADLPLSATAIAAAAGTAITTGTALASASALSSSDADSDSSDASTLLQSFSLDGLGSLLDDEDSTDQKSDAVRSPKKVVQTLSALPTPALSSSLSSSTDLSSSSTGQTLSTELLKVMQQQKNKEKGASQEIIAPKTAQISNNQPSLSVGSSVSKSKPDDNKQMPSSIDASPETYLPLSATAIAAGLLSTDSDSLPLLSGASQHRNKVTTDEKPGNVHQPPSKKPSPTSTASSSSPSTFISSSTTGLSSLSAEQIQKLPSEDLNKLLKQQNDQLDETVEESESQNNDQISSKNKKPTFSTGAAQTSSVSPSNPALTSKLSKQIPTGTDVSSGENLPLTATDLAIGAGNAIATASALSSSDSDSSSVLLPHLQTSSLGDLSLQNDNKDSTDLKSGSIVTPLNKPPQTLIAPSALSSSSLSTDLSSLTTEQIQQFTPEDLVKLLKQPNNQLDKTLSGVIPQNADQISGKDTKPLTISSGASPSSSSHSFLPSSSTLPSTPSLHVQPAASTQSELADSLSTSALASASALSLLSSEQLNQLTEAELIELIQKQQNNQRESNSQRSKSSNSEKDTNQASALISASLNPALLVTPTPSTASIPVSTKQIRPSSSVNLNNGLVNQQAIVGSLNTPSSLSLSTSSQDSIISNQQIVNQNLNSPVKNEASVDQTQTNLEKMTQTEENKQSNEQKTPSPMGSQPSLQSQPKVDLKTPIKSPPSATEQVTGKSNNHQNKGSPIQPIKSISVKSANDAISSASLTSSLTSLTDLSSLSTEQIQQLTKADLVALLQNQNNKEKPTSQETLVPNIRQNSDTPTINSDTESSSTPSTSSSNLALSNLPSTSKLSSKIPINSGVNLEKDLPLSPTVPATVTAKASSLSSADSDSNDETDEEESTEEPSDIIRQSARPVQPPITSSSSPTDLSSLSTQTIKKSNTDDLLKLTQSQNHNDKTSEESSATIIGQNNDKSVNQPTINTITPTPSPPLSLSPANPVLSTSPLTSKLSIPQSVLPLTSINDGIKSDSSISSAAFPLTTFSSSNQGSPSSTAHSPLINGKTDLPLSVTESESGSDTSSTSDSSLISALNKLSKTSTPPSSLSSSQDSVIKQQNNKAKTNSAENFSSKVAQSSDKDNSKSTVSTDARSSSSAPTVNAAVLTLPSTSMISKQIPSSTTVSSEIDLPLATATANAAATALLSASALSSLDSDSSSVDLPLLKSSSKDDLKLENADSTDLQSNIARPSTIPVQSLITSSPSSSTSSLSLSTDSSSNEQTQKLNAADLLKLVQKQTNKEKTNESLAPNTGQNINKESTPVISTSPSTSSQNSVISNQEIINQNLDLPVKKEKSADQRQSQTNSEKQTEQNKQSNRQKSLSLNDSPSSLQPDVKANLQTPIKSSASTSAVEQVTEKSKNEPSSKPSSSLPTIPPPITGLAKKSDDRISNPSTTKSSMTSLTDLSSLSTEQVQQLTKADLIALLQNQNNKEKPTSQETLVPNIRQNSDTPTINSDTESSSTSSASSSNLALSTLTSKPSKQIPNSFDVSSSTVSPLSAKATAVPIPTLSSDSDSSSPVSSMLLAGHIQSPSSTDLSPQQPNNDLIQQKTNLPLPLNKPSQTSINHSSPSSTSSISSQDSTISNPQIITPDLSISTLTNQGSSSNLALLTLPSTSKLSKQLPSNDVSSKTDLSSSATGSATAIATPAALSPPSALSSSGSDSDSSILPSLSTLQASSSDELGSQNDNKDSTDQESDMVRPSEKAAQTPVSPSPSSSSSSSTDLSSTEQALSTESLKVIQQKNKEKGASQESIAPKVAQISNKNDNQPSISGSASLRQQNNKFDKTSKESEASNADQINDKDTKPLTISSGESTSSSPHSAQSSVLPSTLTLPLTLPSASLASPNLLTLPTTSEESFALNIQQNSDNRKNKPTVSSDTDSSSTSSSDSAVLTLPSKLSKQIPSSSEIDLPLTATNAAIATGTAIATAPVLSSSNSGSFPVTLPLSKSNDLGLKLDAYDSTDQQSDIVRQSNKPAQITIISTSVPSTLSSSSTDLSPIATAQNQKLTTIDLLKQIQKQNNKEKTTSEEGLASNIGLNGDQSKKQPTMSTKTSLPSSTGKPSTSIPSFLTLPSTTKLSSSESPLRSQSNTNKQITSSGHVNTEKDLSLLGTTTTIDTASAFSSSNPDSSSLQSSEKIQPTSSGNLHLQHQNKGTANQKSGIVTPLDKLTQTSIAPSSLSSSSLSTDLSSLTTEQIQQLTPQDLVKLLKQPNNQLDKTSSGIITQNADQISGKDTKPLTISSGGPSSSSHSSQFSSSFSSSPSSTSTLLVQPSGSIPSASPAASSSASAFDSASALSALSFLSAEQINQLTEAELIQLIQQQNNQRDSNSQGSESSLSTNLSSLSAEQIQQLTPEDLVKLLKQQKNQSIKTSEGSETNKADQINDKGTKPIAISSDVSSSFSSPTTSTSSALLTSPSTSKISSDLNAQSFNNKQMTNSDHMSSKTGSSSSASKLSSFTASALLAGQIPQASSVDSLSDLKKQHDGVIMQQSGPSSLSAQPSQTQIAVPSASLDSKSLSNEQMQQLSQADLIKLLKEQNNKFGKTSKLSEKNNADQSKDTKSTAISTDASSTSTLLVSPSASSDSSSSAIVDLGSQHQNKGMNDQQKSIVRPTSASSSLSAQQQTTATDQVKQIQNKNIEPKNLQASNIDKMKASSQESSPSVTDLSSLTTEQIRQLTATELLELLKQKNNQWTINGQGGESPNNEQISNTGNKQSTSTMSTPSVRPSPSSSASSTSSSSSTSSLLASPKQNQQTNKLKQQNVGLTNQQSLNHVLLNKPSQVQISSVLPSSSSVAHKDQNVDNQSTKVSMINTNQSPKDSLLPPASAISSGLASSTTSFDAGQINPSNQASTQDLSQKNSASSHSFNQQGKQSSLSTHTRPNQEVKHPTKPGETSPSLTTASSSSSSSTSNSGLTPSTSSVNPTSSVEVNAQHNQKDRGTSGKQTSDFDTGKLADVSSLSSSSASLTPLTTLNEKNSSNQKLTLDDLMKLVQQQQQNNQWNTNSQGERASIGQLLKAIGSINESAQSSSSSSIPLFSVDQKQMEHKNQFNQNKKTDSQLMQMNKQGSTNPIISEDTSASTSASSSSSSESSSSTASADKIQLSKQQQLDLFKLIQQTQYSSKESAALASQFGINRGTTLLSPISSSSSTQSTESVPSSISLSTTNTEQVYFSKQQIVAYLIALIQAQLAKSPQGASPVSSSFSSTYDSTQNYQTDEQQIVVLLIEILQQQQQNDHPTSSLLSLLSKNLFIISELPPQLLSLITSLFTTSLASKAEHLSTINNQMNSADLKRLLQQIKQQSDVEKQLKSQIGSQGEQQLDSSQLISALSRLSSMPQTNAPSVGINPANVQSNKQWNLNSQQQAAIKALQSSQQYKPLDDPSAAAAAASSSMDSQLFEYPILMDPTNTKGLIPTMEDIAEQGILTLENFASDLLGR